MIWAVLLLAAAAGRVVLVDNLVRIPPNSSRAVDIALKQRPAIIECSFSVIRGSHGVRVALVSREHAAQFRPGPGRPIILSTPFQTAGGFRHASAIGEYLVVVDNHLSKGGPAEVQLTVAVLFDEPRELSTQHRITVIVLSLLFLSAVAFFAARRLRGAIRTRSSA